MPKDNIIKNRPVIIKAVKEVWEAIRSFENIKALMLIMNNGKIVIKHPLAFWTLRKAKLDKIFSSIGFGKDISEELNIPDTISIGTEAYKVFAFMITPTAILVVLFKGSIEPESWAFTVYNIKMTISNIMANLFLAKK